MGEGRRGERGKEEWVREGGVGEGRRGEMIDERVDGRVRAIGWDEEGNEERDRGRRRWRGEKKGEMRRGKDRESTT